MKKRIAWVILIVAAVAFVFAIPVASASSGKVGWWILRRATRADRRHCAHRMGNGNRLGGLEVNASDLRRLVEKSRREAEHVRRERAQARRRVAPAVERLRRALP